MAEGLTWDQQLLRVGLARLVSVFREEALTDLAEWTNLEENELKELGLKMGERKKFKTNFQTGEGQSTKFVHSNKEIVSVIVEHMGGSSPKPVQNAQAAPPQLDGQNSVNQTKEGRFPNSNTFTSRPDAQIIVVGAFNLKLKDLADQFNKLNILCKFSNFQSKEAVSMFTCSHNHSKNVLQKRNELSQALGVNSKNAVKINKVKNNECKYRDSCGNLSCWFYHQGGLNRSGVVQKEMKKIKKRQNNTTKKINRNSQNAKKGWRERSDLHRQMLHIEHNNIKEHRRHDQSIREIKDDVSSEKKKTKRRFQRHDNDLQKNAEDNQKTAAIGREGRQRNRDLINDNKNDMRKNKKNIKQNTTRINAMWARLRKVQNRVAKNEQDVDNNLQAMRNELKDEMGQKIQFEHASREQQIALVQAQQNHLERWTKSEFCKASNHREEICGRLRKCEKALARIARLRYDCFAQDSILQVQNHLGEVCEKPARDIVNGDKILCVNGDFQVAFEEVFEIEKREVFLPNLVKIRVQVGEDEHFDLKLTGRHPISFVSDTQRETSMKNANQLAKEDKVWVHLNGRLALGRVMHKFAVDTVREHLVNICTSSGSVICNNILIAGQEEVKPIWAK